MRERARLRSERWRQAHGIGPHKPAHRPWLGGRDQPVTLYYRRRKQVRERAALSGTTRRILTETPQ
jgi:hypothetical protein